jgi:hypothetical protein
MHIEWERDWVNVPADELLRKPDDGAVALEKAKQLLIDMLAEGPAAEQRYQGRGGPQADQLVHDNASARPAGTEAVHSAAGARFLVVDAATGAVTGYGVCPLTMPSLG